MFFNSFFLGSKGLFDFDLTFLLQALLFFLFSYIVTNFFLLPISDTLQKRSYLINLRNQKSAIYLSLVFEKISFALKLFKNQRTQAARELKSLENLFQKEISSEQEVFENDLFNFLRKNEKYSFYNSIFLMSSISSVIEKTLEKRVVF